MGALGFFSGGSKIEKFLVHGRARSARDFFCFLSIFALPPEHMLKGGGKIYSGGGAKINKS